MRAASTSPPTGTVTFLFTDIEGSTRLFQRLGDAYRDLIHEHGRLLRAAFAEGFVSGTEGDAFFVVFRSAPDAVRATVAAQRALAAQAWPDGVEVKVRMGLHTGDGVLAADGEYASLDVHRAARIAAAAHGGEILMSDATRALAAPALDGDLGIADLGEHRLKDLDRPEHLYRLRIAGLAGDFGPPRTLSAPRGNLPADLTPFVGREDVLDEVRALVRDHRLVTLTGAGGSGKTRLALHLAQEADVDDGAWFVQLAPIVDPALVPDAIATALGVMGESGRPVLETVLDHLRGREPFLVLDNLEQVIEAAPIVPAMLQASPGLRIVATSREPLHVDGEQAFGVPPMRVADPARVADPDDLLAYESVTLFLDRARAVQPAFRLDDGNAGVIAEICARLDGLPLAIELAAARVRLLSPRQIADRLDEALPVLSGGGRDRPVRQQTLRDAIAWSHDMLDDAEQACFRRFAVFRGGCTLDGAEAVCRVEGADALDLIGSLVDKSLLRRVEFEGGSRFEMLYVIRGFAKERLADSADETSTRERHASYLVGVLRGAAPHLFGPEQARRLDELEREHDNVRSATSWSVSAGETELALRLVALAWRFWQMRGHLHEGRERVDAALAMPDVEAFPALQADALEAAGGIAYWMADWPTAEARYRACLDLRRSLADEPARAEAAYNLACIAVYGPEPFRSIERAEALLEESLEVFRRLDDALGIAKGLWATGGNLVETRPADAIEAFHESLRRYREVGDRFGEAWALHMLGLAEALTDRLDDAEAHMRASLELFLAADDRSAVSLLLNDFAVVASLRGDPRRGLRLRGAASAVEARSGVGLGESETYIVGVLERMWEAVPRDEAQRCFDDGFAMSVDEALDYATKDEG